MLQVLISLSIYVRKATNYMSIVGKHKYLSSAQTPLNFRPALFKTTTACH